MKPTRIYCLFAATSSRGASKIPSSSRVSPSKSIIMKGCTKAAMRAIVDYIYTGDMDLRNYSLATLLRIMNFSREILIEDDLFNRIEAFLRDLLTVNSSESIANFLKRIADSSRISGVSTATDLMKCPVLVEGNLSFALHPPPF